MNISTDTHININNRPTKEISTMKINLVAENNYKTKTAEDRATAVTQAVEKMINRKLERETPNK